MGAEPLLMGSQQLNINPSIVFLKVIKRDHVTYKRSFAAFECLNTTPNKPLSATHQSPDESFEGIWLEEIKEKRKAAAVMDLIGHRAID